MTAVQRRERSMPLRELTAVSSAPLATICANLIPPEVVAKRRLGWLKRRLAFGLVMLVALLALGYVLVRQSTSSARDDLASAQAETTQLQQRVTAFATVVRVQGETAQIGAQLTTVMASDLQWSQLLGNLARVAPAGLVATDIGAELGSDVTTGQPDPLARTGEVPIGSLEMAGTAKDYGSVATYMETLTRVPGVESIEPGRFGVENGRSTFTFRVNIGKAALGGRFTKPGSK